MRITTIRFIAITSLAVGSMVYILWRPESLTMFSWFAALQMDGLISDIRQRAVAYSTVLPRWVYLSLPQALWVLSGCLAVHSIWRNVRSRHQQLWMFLVLTIALVGELGQAAGMIRGVFDYYDLGVVLAAFLVAQMLAITNTQPERVSG
jgi:hypothetical protein